MTLTLRRLATMVLLLATASLPVAAQTQAQRMYSQAELDQMLAPVALYPDPLLSQLLMAATYPLEVSEAARWSRSNPGLQGDDAVRAALGEDWDPSVQSMVAFPQILAWMDENADWTRRLGEAFLAQEPQVMDTVQQLRRRAQAAGNLQSGEQVRVQQQGEAIVVQSVSPQYIHVPYYDPLVVYGPWWWPAYQPVRWTPWPGYALPYHPGVSAGFWWGRPVGVSVGFFFGNVDWRRGHVRVVHPAAYYYRPPVVVNPEAALMPHRWRHEPQRPLRVRQPMQMQPPVPRLQHPVTVSPGRSERRFEQQHEWPRPRPQANALPSMPVQAVAPARPSAQAQPRREQRARMPEAIAAQRPRAQPEVRPQPQAHPQPRVQQEQRPRTPEAHQPSRAERPERRSDRGHKGSER